MSARGDRMHDNAPMPDRDVHGSTPRPLRRRLFAWYAVVMVGLVAVLPTARAMWLWLASPESLGLVEIGASPQWIAAATAALWGSALLAGRVRGPALLDPWTTHVRAASDLPRMRAFLAPVVRAGLLTIAVTVLLSAGVAAATLAHGLASVATAATFVAAGACAGAIAVVAWLTGQALPRTSAWLAAIIGAFAAAGLVFPDAGGLLPWHLVAASAPTAAAAAPFPLLALTALALGLLALVPALMHRLDAVRLVHQAVTATAARSHLVMFDVNAARSTYRALPSGARRWNAVRSRPTLLQTFVRRDAVGAARMPARLLLGCTGLAIACVLASLPASLGSDAWTWWPIGAIAGLMAFLGLGPLTGGLRHAADAAQSDARYGVSDAALFALHAAFPLAAVALIVMLAGALAAVIGIGVPGALLASSALALLALVARVADALKGAMPVGMLTPIPSEIGDVGALRRAVWAADALLIALGVGVAATVAGQTPVVLVAVAVGLTALVTVRRPRRA